MMTTRAIRDACLASLLLITAPSITGVAVVEVGFAPLRPAEFHFLGVMVPAGTCP